MSESDPPEDDPRERWAYAGIFLAPCLAAAVTVGIAAGALWSREGIGASVPVGAIAVLNAVLAAGGSGLAGLYVPGSLVDRVGRAVIFALVGAFGYVGLLACGGMLAF